MPEDQPSIDVECQHRRVNYTNPLTCMDCGVTLSKDDKDFKVVTIDELSLEKQAAIRAAADQATVFPTKADLSALARPRQKPGLKMRTSPEMHHLDGIVMDNQSEDSADLAAETPTVLKGTPQKVDPPKKQVKGAITKIEALNAKERIFVVNGVKFFAAVTDSGFRVLSACHESKKTLESAARVLEIKGWIPKVKRSKEDKSLFTLEAKEKRPSGPWPDKDPEPEEKKG